MSLSLLSASNEQLCRRVSAAKTEAQPDPHLLQEQGTSAPTFQHSVPRVYIKC